MKEIGQTIIKHQTRYDFEIIAQMIKRESKVIDIGCGDGELLAFLKTTRDAKVRGLELVEHNVNKALIKGIPVVQGDAEADLDYYPDNSFDYAILSQTLQATKQPKKILKEMLRIANTAIVSFPNFAHIRNRSYLFFHGTMPVSKTIPYQWYDTPNIHFCSIRDFEKLCAELGFRITEKKFLTNTIRLDRMLHSEALAGLCANFLAEYGIFSFVKNEVAVITEAVRLDEKMPKIELSPV